MDGYRSPEALIRADGATSSATPDSLADFLGAPHWLERQLEPPEPLLGEIITNTTRMFIGGPTGLGKTHLALAMAAGMATGQGFLHWKASRPCRVLYVDGEMPRDLVQERLGDIRRRMGGADLSDLSGLFVLCAEDCEELAKRFPALGEFAPLNTPAGQDFIRHLVNMLGRRRKVDVVFFDNRMSLLCGDMKEEQPWTDTMPLVKDLTQARIAQVWIDHTGHNTGQLYGTKTKEWQFDSVALLSKVDQPGVDVAFTLEFTKARRRKPSNRADFETCTFAMVDDQWTVEAAAPAVAAARAGKGLTASEQGWLRDLTDMFAEPESGAEMRPVPGPVPDASGPSVLTLTRDRVRTGFRQRGRFTLTPDANLTGADRERLRSMLNALKDKGKIGLAEGFVWLLDPRQVASGSRQPDEPGLVPRHVTSGPPL